MKLRTGYERACDFSQPTPVIPVVNVHDSRNNVPHIGNVLMARGRDASDIAIATTFGPDMLHSFRVLTHEMTGPRN